MGSGDEVVEIDSLQRNLLVDGGARCDHEEDPERVLYAASFEETEHNFIKYQTAQWAFYSLLLVLAWGIGLLMFLYLPVRRYILRKEIRSRKLYLTTNAIVYKVTRPVPFPCLGVLHKEKHVLLRSVSDVIIEQGYLQSLFGVYSIRIENVGVRKRPSDDVRIMGAANPIAFRKAVLMHLSSMRNEAHSRHHSVSEEDVHNVMASPSKSFRHDGFSYSGERVLLQKLEEVGSSVKRVQSLIEERNNQIPEHID